jgi:Tol biopolymer transport system component
MTLEAGARVGRWLGFQVKRGDDTHIRVIPSEGGEPAQVTDDRGQSRAFGWSPDSDKVLFAGFRDNVWNVWCLGRGLEVSD